MIDFIEYVLNELKSKRLSKANAIALVRQYSRRSPSAAAVPVIHPLLHRNTSDLVEQRYSSTFTGDEHFLADHQVRADGGGRRVLPGVAYLEMARAAVEQALPRPEGTVLELHNTVWAQPVVVLGSTQVNIALSDVDDERVDYEVYSQDGEQEVVHCQGQALVRRESGPATLDLEALRAEMLEGGMEADALYEACARMGLLYGPALQSVESLARGTNQVLARLRLPSAAADDSDRYFLHPSVMDGALQAAVGLAGNADATEPRLPFALDTLRILAPCAAEMYAWLRLTPGSRPSDKILKLDIDLCDVRGNVAVQMRGFSWRALTTKLEPTSILSERVEAGTLIAVPQWQESPVAAPHGGGSEFAERHLVVCEQLADEVEALERLVSPGGFVSLQASPDATLAQRYSDHAIAVFERVQDILRRRPQGKVLLQLVVPNDAERAVLAGLSALLRTAAQENPQFRGQTLLVPADVSWGDLARIVEAETEGALDALVRYDGGSRRIVRWQEAGPDADSPAMAFKDGGVYLITGGRGGLGSLFAKEILERTRGSHVVLTGRAPASPDALSRFVQFDGRVSYRRVDLESAADVVRLIDGIGEKHGRLDGILHSAGAIADDFILRKTSGGFRDVLAPKVAGTFHLDQATRDIDLDFFVLFSAIGGALGNLGQADYATANAFMDHFAAYRNRLVASGERHGRTRSINWPLWKDGGMGVDPANQERLRQTTGMQPMAAAAGMAAFHRGLVLSCDQMMVVEGDRALIRRALLGAPATMDESPAGTPATVAELDSATLAEKTEDYLRRELAETLKVPAQKIDPRAALENYGIDSILAMRLTNQLETAFGSLPKTLFFEFQTIRDLAGYFIEHHAAQLTALFSSGAPRTAVTAPAKPAARKAAASSTVTSTRRKKRRGGATGAARAASEPIAIVGLSGRYPEAFDVEAYWENLREGRDCITEVPKDRWDWRAFFSEDRSKSGHHYSKWGGFIAGVDEFDPLFFNISPVEAETIDPQERLFLQHAWMAMEDAGYTRSSLQIPMEGDLPGQVGVYVGVMYTEYQMFGAEALARGKRRAVPGSAASIANRVSYALNLHGPSMTLDTMCSSSLTAIHLACEDLKHGRTYLALAGGVNVSIHPNKYLVLSEGQFISGDGHCQSFGEGGDGYIPGEGVGVVVLKRLSDAERDGDHIYGIIRGSALNHGGKTNGYSVPNPQAQTSAISRALKESGVNARHISYIEAHGTGTKLGDPIEIAALNKAFQKFTRETGFCLIGSAKSNIGHCESAAGIAGLTKVLLQMQHRQIVPSLHSAKLNPHIDFPKSPFVVNQTLTPWEPPVIEDRRVPRIAGISSFGAGGSNAHIIVEEYVPPAAVPVALESAVIVLSARTGVQLQQKARDLLKFVRPRLRDLDLAALAYTLQTGREAMEERLGFLVRTPDELAAKLESWLEGTQGAEDVHQGQLKRNNDTLSLFLDSDLQQAIDRWIAGRKLSKLLELWVKGLEVDWSRLYDDARPRRMSLPVYPFARERYWVEIESGDSAPAERAAAAVLHPLLHSNISDLSEQRYRTTFTGDEFFLSDHQVAANGQAGQKVLPGVVYLEMARAAIEQALPRRVEGTMLELRNTVWAQPVVVDERKDVRIALVASDDERVDYEIYSGEGEEEIVHCQGRAVLSHASAPERISLEQLRTEMEGQVAPDSVYATLARMGLVYGPAFQTITAIHRGSGQVLAYLRLPAVIAEKAGPYVLHPSLMDGALQAAVALLDGESTLPRLPFALETLRIIAPCAPQMTAWVRLAPGSQPADAVVKLDVDLCDASGNVCAQMHGFSTRTLGAELASARAGAAGSLIATPVWHDSASAAEPWTSEQGEHSVVLCELPQADKLAALLPQSVSLVLKGDPAKTVAQRYSDHALACFERIQAIFQTKPQGRILFQVVIDDTEEKRMLSGLSGLLKTAGLENPRFFGQVIAVPAHMPADELAARLRSEQPQDPLVHYENGVRRIVRWQEVPVDAEKPPVAFREDGVYLIVGGMGGLGTLFAREIFEQTREARVVLTGRSPFDGELRARLEALSETGRIDYRQLDLSDADQVARVIAGIHGDYGRLDGILHSAGMIADSFILKKDKSHFSQVLEPKVTGTWNLDQASKDLALDFFVLFSSVSGATGNLGQADYAAANAFMDVFAWYRNRLVAAGRRRGRTRSINWPLWHAGGMTVDAERQELMLQVTGMQPMRTATGLEAFHRSLALPHDQTLVVAGNLAQLRRTLLAGPSLPVEEEPPAPAALEGPGLTERAQEFLRKELATVLKLPPGKIDPQAALEEYGIDSILAMKLTSQLEKTFGSLPKTLFFEYQTVDQLVSYFTAQHAAQLTVLLAPAAEKPSGPAPSQALVPAPAKLASSRRAGRLRSAAQAPTGNEDPIAIIGLSGRYPEAGDIAAYWDNLRNGRDCITEVPKERWDWREYFSEDRGEQGHHYSKWGGFISGVDEFDPLFFNISPVDAEVIDPQERLFLQHVWAAVEDAGYTRAALQAPAAGDLPGQVGVYVGVMYSEYQMFGAEAGARGKRLPVPGSTASIANRVSYVLNLHGPSVTLDTMCSSSLTAIHFACQDLKLGRTNMAIAGGVNVTIHPNKYLVLSAGQFISSAGHCQSFGEGGDGYIPGEGVGVVVLKRLSEAKRDGDHIYGVIRASALNHGGKTNGYTVPNPQAQASVVARALAESKIDPRHISYIEAHGTGTTLGDPIEIAALSKAFRQYTQDTQYCLIGSAKSNIGHCESAAGIAGLTKVLLQMQHQEIVPSLHSAQLNPHIDFSSSPFIVSQALRPWEPPVIDGRTLPRIAGVSSFGAGGSNAHLLIEEYRPPAQQPMLLSSVVIVLSARTAEQLHQRAADLLAFIRRGAETIDPASLAWTLQCGREAMEHRLGFVVKSIDDLASKLESFLSGERMIEDAYFGEVTRNNEALSLFSTDADLKQTVDKWIAGRRLAKLLDLWVKGLDLDWGKLYGESHPARMSLPTYPFARERYWVDAGAGVQASMAKSLPAAVLHPLLHSNTSDLNEQRYRSFFQGDEFFLADHQVQLDGRGSERILPGVAYLEMARAALEQAVPERPASSSLELRNVVWAQPIIVSAPRRISIALSPAGDDRIDYEIYSQDGEQEIVHGQGCAVFTVEPAPARLDPAALEARMANGRVEPAIVYGTLSRMGLHYGPAFQGIVEILRGAGQVLARLRLPKAVEPASADYVLHPSMMDSALQATVGLIDDLSSPASEPRLPFALDSLRIVAPCTPSMFAWIRHAAGSQPADRVVKLDIDLCHEDGNVCVQLRGLLSRVVSREARAIAGSDASDGSLLAVPVWQASAIESFTPLEFTERHVVLCELPNVELDALGSLLPLSECLVVQAEEEKNIAQRYTDYAVACFERVQAIFQNKREGKVLMQVVVADGQEHSLLAGLSGLLKTAALENPQFIGQLILVPPGTKAEELGRYLNREKSRGLDTLVRYQQGVRRVLRWQEVAAEPGRPALAFRDRGVYLITGGTGGLGLLFAREILDRAADGRVVLTGRSPLSTEIQSILEKLSRTGRVTYRQVDLGDAAEVEQLVQSVQSEQGRLDGILHSAGMIADRFILNKTAAELTAVLTPKVSGTVHLDLASRDVELDFFVLFSSIAGAMGNPGQADYAMANGFMDQFAAYRNAEVAAGRRHGRTRSINWPLWQSGGMKLDRAAEELMRQTTGMHGMQTAIGMEAFHRCLALSCDQMLVVEGDLARIRRVWLAEPEVPAAQAKPATAGELAGESFAERTQDYLRREFSELLKLPFHKIDPQAPLEKYGIDSILAMRLTNQLEKTFGSLSKTLFFEYQTIAALAGYLMKSHAAVLREKFGLLQQEPAERAQRTAVEPRKPVSARRSRNRFGGSRAQARSDIAIVGLAGRYPQAGNLLEFWRNLKEGRDCITEIPPERWDHRLYFDPDPNKAGRSYSKWGGFIADVDKFDPLFFNISPKEAEVIDPQERLFLETAWETIEDAGHTRESIAGRRVGVYVGVMWSQYELFGAESVARGNPTLGGSSHASIANRVSYFFDLHGPSIALDTMCSSSLTAIHLACEELRRGEIEAAIAGGVNISIHPYKYLSLSHGRFAATDGRCRSFGAGGDGYVPGEGVGAVLLKPLEHALRDGDQIYAVIKSSTVNHGGKTNGYSVPNPNAQGDLIREALRKGGIDPKTLSYIETHGTGTSLGDPIEITGLLKAFDGAAGEKQFCPIGSVKSNIGHLESAAGIAALTKVLLQIRHKQLVPSLHAEPLNPNIDFENSPFYVQTELSEWKRPDSHPRRVGISSFGAGGANAHLILEEYTDDRESEQPHAAQREVFLLSAKTPDALRRYAERVVRYLDEAPDVSLPGMAYTSQIGRSAMDARLAVLASSVEELKTSLREWLTRFDPEDAAAARGLADPDGVFYGSVKDAPYTVSFLTNGPAGRAFLGALLAGRDLEKIAGLWVLGADVQWSLLHPEGSRAKVSLPTYPFARERYWVSVDTPSLRVVQERAPELRKVIAAAPVEEPRRTYYVPQWTARALGARDEKAGGPVLVLDPADGLFEALKKQAGSDSAASIILVKPGLEFQESGPNEYSFDVRSDEDLQRLVDRLRERALIPAAIVHRAGTCSLEIREEVERELHNGFHALLALCGALMREMHPAPLRVLSVVSNDSAAASPLAAAVDGFFRTLTLEDPRFATKSVDVESGDGTFAEQAAIVWNELLENEWTRPEIRYRRSGAGEAREMTRSVRTLVPMAAPDRRSPLPLKQNGVYLITGGMGGLGLIFAEYLAKKVQARLVLVGRSAPSEGQTEKIERLRSLGAEVLVLQADVSVLEDAERVVREIRAQFNTLDGVLHSAGVNRDAFILRKTRQEVDAVLAPKVHGTIALDLATAGENLDFFVLFSSIAGVMGNAGQSDYAFGNRFQDAFAERRESLRKERKRNGRTISINWPLWEEGGMGVAPDKVVLLEKQTGMIPLPSQEGVQYWEDLLRSDATQCVALYGIASRIASVIGGQAVRAERGKAARAESADPAALSAKTEAYLKALVGEEIKLAPERIGSTERLESFGIDSVMINKINAQLERDLGALPKTLLYEHETIRELAAYLVREAREALITRLGIGGVPEEPAAAAEQSLEEETVRYEVVSVREREEMEAVAIIGVHGSYPHSEDLNRYWENLENGRDLIDLVPPSRWDYEEFYHPDPAASAEGKIYCKWGGFLDHFDRFDPHFFKISTAEAKMLDPQERLFLESVWAAIEDAGYTRERLRTEYPKDGSADVGVFVGVTTNSYQLWGPEERTHGNFVCPTAMPWSIANRVSYFFDFSGPSLPIDSACSSSLVAMHLACESLRSGECQVAIAGGVNLYLHPAKYLSLCQKRMVSLDGRCHSYGAGDDGFVPGEGVGTVVLKPLRRALEDGDRIYGVIRASAYDHAGRSNGYSAPNPNAQASLITRTLQKAGIHPESISYIEGHGTGTQLGDSIEIAALTKAFQQQTAKKQFCPIGCVKSNIGHSESAAGVAGLAKVLLQMRHRKLVPSIHSEELNPNIELESSPFYVQHALSEWNAPAGEPRRALINSFGAGGVNACLVVEEPPQTAVVQEGRESGPCLFVLSARNEERLREYAERVVAHLRMERELELASFCYTLQTGREAMEERLALVVSDANDLAERLSEWSRRGSAPGIHRGSLGPRRTSKRSLKLVRTGMGEQSLVELASKWVAGEEVDWESLHSRTQPRRCAAPTYPFARERYWVSDALVPEKPALTGAHLHPLIAYNSSTLKEVRFSSSLPENAFYAVDHRVLDEKIFPGAGFLEMACIAANMASEQRVRKIRDVVWMHPLSFRGGTQVLRTVLRQTGANVEYEISSLDDENETVVHSEGRLVFGNGWEEPAPGAAAENRIPPEALMARCARSESGATYYEKFSAFGLHYGASFQTVQEIHAGRALVVAKLKIADHLRGEFGQFILHPSMIDGALQTIAALVGGSEPQVPHLPFALDEIEILKPLPQTCYAVAEPADGRMETRGGVTKFNIRIVNANGEVLIRLRNLYVRPVVRPQASAPTVTAAQPGAKRRLLGLSGGPVE